MIRRANEGEAIWSIGFWYAGHRCNRCISDVGSAAICKGWGLVDPGAKTTCMRIPCSILRLRVESIPPTRNFVRNRKLVGYVHTDWRLRAFQPFNERFRIAEHCRQRRQEPSLPRAIHPSK